MPNEDQEQQKAQADQNPDDQTTATQQNPDEESSSSSSSDSDSDSDSDSASASESESEAEKVKYEPDYNYSESDSDPNEPDKKNKDRKLRRRNYISEEDKSPEANIKRFSRLLRSRRYQKMQERRLKRLVPVEDLFDFPRDKENWREEDLKELWADAPIAMTKPGWDPAWADEEDWEIIEDEVADGKDPPIAPFYLPYRRFYPAIPNNHYDIRTPQDVIEELDRIEEFLRWVSYVFPDGSSYEGTVWDDLAHGKGVYVAEQGLVRYEGEWLQNNMEGHGVVEVEIPDIEPVPGSKLEAQMRAEGRIIKRDFMSPEDKEWMEMDIEDTVRLVDGRYETPWYEKDIWIKLYDEKPEVGRYRYAGQWKHSRMHGCGVYEVNERPVYGRFYFGELLNDPAGCDEDACALHAGIAEVAAAKARMFINKPDGMVREERGPYGDPQHPYLYEGEDVWQAPGFINQFHEVPDYWKTYVNEVDIEREMWLNSFYKAPLRLPMPAELEYWWQNEAPPEFILLRKEPEPDPNDPSKLVYTEDPVILHTPTGRVINFIEDEEHGVRMFWQPPLKEGEDVDPEKVEFLPLGFDEFYGREQVVVVKRESFFNRLISSMEKALKPWFEKIDKLVEEQKKASEMRKELMKQEMELIDDELELEEAIEDMEEDLKQQEKEAEKSVEMDSQEEDSSASLPDKKEDVVSPQENVEEEEEDEEEDDSAPSSFGSVADQDSTKNKGTGSGRSPFSTLSFASSGLLSTVPSMVDRSLLSWKIGKPSINPKVHASFGKAMDRAESSDLVAFPRAYPEKLNLKAKFHGGKKFQVKHQSRKFGTSSQISSASSQTMYSYNHQKGNRNQRLNWLHEAPETNLELILSLHIPVQCSDLCFG